VKVIMRAVTTTKIEIIIVIFFNLIEREVDK